MILSTHCRRVSVCAFGSSLAGFKSLMIKVTTAPRAAAALAGTRVEIRLGALLLLISLGGRPEIGAAAAEPSPRLTDGPALNLGFEIATVDGRPAGWQPRSIGADAAFALDKATVHEGRSSARISALEDTRSYFYSGLIPVTPGETVSASAWVKTAGVPSEKGAVILIADFLVAEHAPLGGPMKVAVAAKTGGWELIRGAVTAPARANFMQLRCGFSYSQGTCWWDDVRVTLDQPVAARVVMHEGRLVPAGDRVPIEIFNRAGRRESVTVRLTHGRNVVEQVCALSGEFRQRVELPLRGLAPGRQQLTLELIGANTQRLASTGEQMVTVPPPLTVAPLIPTHWVREDGPPRFEAEVWAALREQRPDAQLSLRVIDAAGRECATQRVAAPESPVAGSARFQVTLPVAELGAYRVQVSVEGGASPGFVVEQPWHVIARERVRVTLDAEGFPVAGGRVLFPLGMFNNTAKLEESAAAGFNLVHMYNAARVEPGSRPDDQRLKNELDRAERLGLRCLLLVPMEFAAAGQWAAFSRRIRMFRNHPALLAWDEEEGLARGDLKLADLHRIRQILQEEDPHHPFMVGDARDVIGRITDRSRMFPHESMDLAMWWWYPFPLKARATEALEGTEAGGPVLEPPTFLTQRQTAKPIWVGVQAYRKPGASERYPTPAEYRAQAYLALISGAKGLMWYGGSVTGGLFANPREGHWDALKTLVREVSGLAPLLCTPGRPAPVLAPAAPVVSAGWREAAGRGVLMIVNRSPQPWHGAVHVPGLAATALTPLGEDGAQPVIATAGAVRVILGAYGTRVLTW